MVVIRGATTIPCDDKEEIRKAVKELLEQIESCNALKRDEFVSLVFSSTSSYSHRERSCSYWSNLL